MVFKLGVEENAAKVLIPEFWNVREFITTRPWRGNKYSPRKNSSYFLERRPNQLRQR